MKSYGIKGRRRSGWYTTNIWEGKKLIGRYDYCLHFVCHGEWEQDGKRGFPPCYYLAYSNDYDELRKLMLEYAENPWQLLKEHGKGAINLGTSNSEIGAEGIYIFEDGSVKHTGIATLGNCSDHLYD